ncbi:hypothetical protein BU15DRAFT_60250 [Melanogaster broomeanus]|nr:hypothetical protein BU15DRAFT_60250 [Melanogaster broomeanus]
MMLMGRCVGLGSFKLDGPVLFLGSGPPQLCVVRSVLDSSRTSGIKWGSRPIQDFWRIEQGDRVNRLRGIENRDLELVEAVERLEPIALVGPSDGGMNEPLNAPGPESAWVAQNVIGPWTIQDEAAALNRHPINASSCNATVASESGCHGATNALSQNGHVEVLECASRTCTLFEFEIRSLYLNDESGLRLPLGTSDSEAM